MKKLLLIQITILMSAFSFAKIEVLDRVAIIVDEGVVMESQIRDLVQTTKLRSIEQGMQLPPTEALLDEVQEQLIIQELQLQRGEEFGIRISDGELNQTFIQIAANNGVNIEQFISDYEASGQSYEKLREEIRRDMIIQRVQRGIVSGSINITAQEIEGFFQGRILELGPTEAVWGAPRHPYTKSLIDAAPIPDPSRKRAARSPVQDTFKVAPLSEAAPGHWVAL